MAYAAACSPPVASPDAAASVVAVSGSVGAGAGAAACWLSPSPSKYDITFGG